MNLSIAFIDIEVDPRTHLITDFGAVGDDASAFHGNSFEGFATFLGGARFVCGHNILDHDIRYIRGALRQAGIDSADAIDTLLLSPLFFPEKRYHALSKEEKLQPDEPNNPLTDAKKARMLFDQERDAFERTDEPLRRIFFGLLGGTPEFRAFFRVLSYSCERSGLADAIRRRFATEICMHADLEEAIANRPIELAYSLSQIDYATRYRKTRLVASPWVLRNYPDVERMLFRLRHTPCAGGCPYCDGALDIRKGLKRWFGFDSFRTYAGESLQEQAVRAAVENGSLLAVFPTGGGKSLTFQLPALMSGEAANGLTVVISPLQSLMKDQVDNLERAGITDAVTVNGLLDPIERAESIERVEAGAASILYLSPESLRSKTIERLLLGRNIARFVIDEAHCFSAWGQDFRVDYLYIGDFIRSIQEKKGLPDPIPVSCFTATAKQKVIEDICSYFREKLSLEFEVFASKASRTNLRYRVLPQPDAAHKYRTLRDLLEAKECPTIVYVSRTHRADRLTAQLNRDGFSARAYHGKMDARVKTANQNAFIAGEFPIMVATSAFGMGVDKKDVGMVIHYDLSDSLENYIQEAGRAGRNERIEAECYVLYNEADLNAHFALLNQTKLTFKEIQQVWRAVKGLARIRPAVSVSALELARKAGWNDSGPQIETRATTAIAALEEAGYLRRGQNMPRVYANSIRSRTAQEAIEKIRASPLFDEKRREYAERIIKKLISCRSRERSGEEIAESRIDYIGDHLGIRKEEVINVVTLLREAEILDDAQDLTAFIPRNELRNRAAPIVGAACWLEKFLFDEFEDRRGAVSLKEINEEAAKALREENRRDLTVNVNKIKILLNFWAVKNWIGRKRSGSSGDEVSVTWLLPKEGFRPRMELRHRLAAFILDLLYKRKSDKAAAASEEGPECAVAFSVLELKREFSESIEGQGAEVSVEDVEDALFFLSRIEALKLEGGFLVVYNRLTIERLERDNRKLYKQEDYRKLHRFYENKIQQIHIVGEYARKMIDGEGDARRFVDDYFGLSYDSFLDLYFKGDRQKEIALNMTPAMYRRLFGGLSRAQMEIVSDKDSKHIVVAAGPGSGKTLVLVRKLASLMALENVKHEQLLMLTFSRAAATEFKRRLIELVDATAAFIEIKTFHSYCFDLLGQIGSLDRADDVLRCAVERIDSGEVELSRITKTVLVIDEAQDMNADEFALVEALMRRNEDMRVIAVGDDDQNIYEFRQASSRYLRRLVEVYGAVQYELVENYRSRSNLVEFTNRFAARCIRDRLKKHPISAKQPDEGEIKVVRYRSTHLVEPLVADILAAGRGGSTCVLTKTNDEALQVSGLLLKKGVPARLIQDNRGFSLLNLAEIRSFLSQLERKTDTSLIGRDEWESAKERLQREYRSSDKLESCLELIRAFEAVNPERRYKTDLELFIRESKLDECFREGEDTIFVSTIHKAKGKEFDRVFLLLDNFELTSDEAARQLYVAMTRARRALTIHLNSDLLDGVTTEGVRRIEDENLYAPPRELALQLTHTSVWLDYCAGRQAPIDSLRSGDMLSVKGDELLAPSGRQVLKFSRKFSGGEYERLRRQGYVLKSARVNFIVHWRSETKGAEIKIVLPELFFERERDEPVCKDASSN